MATLALFQFIRALNPLYFTKRTNSHLERAELQYISILYWDEGRVLANAMYQAHDLFIAIFAEASLYDPVHFDLPAVSLAFP